MPNYTDWWARVRAQGNGAMRDYRAMSDAELMRLFSDELTALEQSGAFLSFDR